MKMLVKTFNKILAKKLIDLKFEYVTETINGEIVYGFILTDELSKYIRSNFSNENFFQETKLRF